ncbi:amidohydrolase family protein [Nocardioides sp. LHG3406-4]|uniref:amidohydrolase family protein n=1 Tax=Nocardioides sp. LHG3406-4 TaxID=2804575 RepID=UPI003CF3AF2F
MTIDIHAHTIPAPLLVGLAENAPSIAPRLEDRDGELYFHYPSGRVSGPTPAGMSDTAARLADMDASGVRTQALSVPPTHFSYAHGAEEAAAAATLHNDAMVDMALAHPDRFVVLGTLPLQDTDLSLKELDRLLSIEQVVGLEFGTNVAGRNLDDPDLAPIWGAVADAGLAVVLHPDNVAGAQRMHDHYLHNFVGNPTDTTVAAGSLMFGGVLTDHPNLRIALLHGGGFLPYQIGRFEHGWSVRPEPQQKLSVSPRSLLGRFWFDTLTHDTDSLRFLLERVGADRLCLGTDYPFDMADATPLASIEAAIPDAAVAEQVSVSTPRELLTRRPPRGEGSA